MNRCVDCRYPDITLEVLKYMITATEQNLFVAKDDEDEEACSESILECDTDEWLFRKRTNRRVVFPSGMIDYSLYFMNPFFLRRQNRNYR